MLYSVSLTRFVYAALGGSIGLLWQPEEIDVCYNDYSDSPG